MPKPIQLYSKDQTVLNAHLKESSKEKAIVVLVHGFAEHGGRYQEIQQRLAIEGYTCAAIDLRGHGKSGGQRGYVDSFGQYIEDVQALVLELKKDREQKPLYIWAHSMGALVAIRSQIEKAIETDGVILSSPLLGIRVKVPAWKNFLGEVMARVMPRFSLPNGIDAKLLSHDPKKVRERENDPLIFHKVTARWFSEVQKLTTQTMGEAKDFTSPVLLQLSESDFIVDFEKNCLWYNHIASKDKEKKVYLGYYHEIYNESDRHIPINNALEWLNARCPDMKKEASRTPVERAGLEA